MTWACYEWRPSWICPIWRPRREPSLAPAKNQTYMTLATSGPNLQYAVMATTQINIRKYMYGIQTYLCSGLQIL